MPRTEAGPRATPLDAYQQAALALTVEVHDLTADGLSARAIARQLGVSRRTVHRHRAAPRPEACPCCGHLAYPDDLVPLD